MGDIYQNADKTASKSYTLMNYYFILFYFPFLLLLGSQFLWEQANVVIDNMHYVDPVKLRTDYNPLLLHCLKVKHVNDDEYTKPNEKDMGSHLECSPVDEESLQNQVIVLQKKLEENVDTQNVIVKKIDDFGNLIRKK